MVWKRYQKVYQLNHIVNVLMIYGDIVSYIWCCNIHSYFFILLLFFFKKIKFWVKKVESLVLNLWQFFSAKLSVNTRAVIMQARYIFNMDAAQRFLLQLKSLGTNFWRSLSRFIWHIIGWYIFNKFWTNNRNKEAFRKKN